MQNKVITITDGTLTVRILTVGATIYEILFPDRSGRLTDLIVGYPEPDDYLHNGAFFGATVGRCANRIGGARFSIDGETYHLTENDHGSCIHGGKQNFTVQEFEIAAQSENSVTLRVVSPDGTDGFPGTVTATVMYTVQNSALSIEYEAVSDRDTVINMTNHAYFNLAGEGSVLQTTLCSPADRYCPGNQYCLPVGVEAVDGTPFDFRAEQPISVFRTLPHPQTDGIPGFDHHFFVPGEGYRPFVTAKCDKTGIRMDVTSTQEGFQLYTAPRLHGAGKHGTELVPFGAFCIEAQCAPDAINHPYGRMPLFRAGETYREKTTYAFRNF